jgi:hypothetical protein
VFAIVALALLMMSVDFTIVWTALPALQQGLSHQPDAPPLVDGRLIVAAGLVRAGG